MSSFFQDRLLVIDAPRPDAEGPFSVGSRSSSF